MNFEPIRIAIAMMARDEETRLEAWILYHASIVGFENLYIFDNGSVSPQVHRILRMYEKRGVNVDRSHTGHSNFTRKGIILSELFQNLETKSDYRLFVPMDCDEFISVQRPDGLVVFDRYEILSYLSSLQAEHCVLVANKARANIFGYPGHFFPPYDHHKVFFPRGVCLSMDEGFHTASSRTGNNDFDTNLMYLHFHYRPFKDMVRQSAWKLEGEVDISNSDALRDYKGSGHHVAQYLLMKKNDYIKGFSPHLGTSIPDFINYLKRIGIGRDFFDSI